MAQIDDLNAAIASIKTNATTAAAAIQTELNSLEAALAAAQASGTAPDLTTQIANLNSIASQVAAIGQEVPTPATPAPAPGA